MNTKPLSEWTLAEVKAECEKHSPFCDSEGDCEFYKPLDCSSTNCVIRRMNTGTPLTWDLAEPPRWTEQDKDDVRTIKCVLPWAKSVSRDGDGALFTTGGLNLNRGLLPSLQPGKSVSLDEILDWVSGE